MEIEILEFEGKTITYIAKGSNEKKTAELTDVVKPEYVKIGKANADIINDKVHYCKMSGSGSTQGAVKKDNHIVKISGKNFMTYEGVLNKVHEKSNGEFSITTISKWVSEDMKMAWCSVRLTVGDKMFDGEGSSTPDNTGSVTDHPIELANTRAKGRAFRDYLNIGQVMAEELKQLK